MNKQFTASEVRESAIAVVARDMEYEAEMLQAYADLLEAQEKAVPVAWLRDSGVDIESEGGCITNAVRNLWLASNPKHVERYTIPLFTHPVPSDAEKRDTMTPRELAKRIERGEKWKLAGEPAPCQSQDAERLAEALLKYIEPYLDTGDSRTAQDWAVGVYKILAAHSTQAQPADNELPGMWSHSDFVGGDPDERSYAERQAQPPAASVTSANADMYWLDSDPEHLSFEDIPSALEYVEGDDITTVTLQRARKLSDITVPVRFNNECGNYEIDEAALAAQENPNG